MGEIRARPATCVPVRGWFTEAFYPPGLKEATPLLSELV